MGPADLTMDQSGLVIRQRGMVLQRDEYYWGLEYEMQGADIRRVVVCVGQVSGAVKAGDV